MKTISLQQLARNLRSQTVHAALAALAFGADIAQAATPGGMVAWGSDEFGQNTVPRVAQSGVTAAAVGSAHTVALKDDGSVLVWGGQTAVPVAAQSGVVAIAAGAYHTVALKNDGSVLAWGWNDDGQTNVPEAAQSGVIAIAAGYCHTVILKEDGSVVGWGCNPSGQTTVPTNAQSGVTAIAAGAHHTVALKNDGSVVAWGHPQTTNVPTDAQSGVTAIAAGSFYTVALTTNGRVLSWSAGPPVPEAAQSGVTAIAAGGFHTVALKTDGSIVAWGDNRYGQTSVPEQAQSGVSAIAAGFDHTVAIVRPTALDDPARLDWFIFQQMDRFNSVRPPGQPPLVQSYDCYRSSDENNYYRGDVYDQGVAICYLLARGRISRAQQLADALLYLQDHDRIPDGRLHAAYWPNDLLSPDDSETSIKDPNISPGNMSFAGIGLAKTFVATGEEKYLVGARRCADWILNNLKHTDGPGGFSGGLTNWNYAPATWRSTEHNVDVYVLATSLFNLTQDPKWQSMAECAAGFVRAMYNTNAPSPGYYFTGTGGDGVTVNPSPIPADGQSWSALARLDTTERATNALNWLWTNLLVTCGGGTYAFEGVKHSSGGTGVASEQTAGAAMAYSIYGDSARAARLLADLQGIRLLAASCEANGVVAGPCDGCTADGFGGCISPKPHVASTAWSGLAYLVANGDASANPLKPIPGTPLRISRQGAAVCLSWPSISGTNYWILVSSNIDESVTWNATPVGQTNRWCEPENLQSDSRFYRLKTQ